MKNIQDKYKEIVKQFQGLTINEANSIIMSLQNLLSSQLLQFNLPENDKQETSGKNLDNGNRSADVSGQAVGTESKSEEPKQ